jgi:hypothetical protein
MTRELETKAAAALLKKKFSDKGASLPHTEALDILAQLKGYEAWSHLKAATRHSPAVVKASEMVAGIKQGFIDRLNQERGEKGVSFWDLATAELTVGQLDFETYPQQDWKTEAENGDTSAGYWDWLLSEMEMRNELYVRGVKFSKAPPVAVLVPDGTTKHCDIQQNLTDRWGDLNTALLEQKPALPFLVLQDSLLERLRRLMAGEDTFIVMKDEEYGLLFEIEYVSAQSEESFDDQLGRPLPTHDEVVECLRKGLLELQTEYPLVEFCIPPKEEVANERPAVWGFLSGLVADKMTQSERESLALKLTSIECPASADASDYLAKLNTSGT